MKVMHFNSTKERLDFLKGKHEEIIPKKAMAEIKPKKAEKQEEKAEPKKKATKKKTAKKKEKTDGEVQAD